MRKIALIALPVMILMALPLMWGAAQGPVVVYGFEDGLQGWSLVEDWAGGVEVSQSDERASEGDHALRLMTTFGDLGGWEEAGAKVTFDGAQNWSAYARLQVDVYAPEDLPEGFIVQFYAKTGGNWNWNQSENFDLAPGEWVTCTIDLDALPDLNAVQEFGFKAGMTDPVFKGAFFVDNFRVYEKSAPVAGEAGSEAVLYGFEEDLQDWFKINEWGSGLEVTRSDERASEGDYALKLATQYEGAGWQEAGVGVALGLEDWAGPYKRVSVDIYAPEDLPGGYIVQIYTLTGGSWSWTQSPNFTLSPGSWNTFTVDLVDMGDVANMQRFGIKIGSSDAPYEGAFYIDNVAVALRGDEPPTPTPAYEPTPYPISESTVNAFTNIESLTESVKVYDKFEVRIDLEGEWSNPYDPEDVKIDATFNGPNGEEMTVPGFWYQAFEVGDRPEPSHRTRDWSWRVRFTPVSEGEWSYAITAEADSGAMTSDSYTFEATAPDDPGFLRISEVDPQYPAFDNGDAYLAIGENMGWYTADKMLDYDRWMSKLSEAGGNYIRVWMASWSFQPEWLDTGLGQYDERQAQMFRLDTLFRLADEYDIYVMLCLLNHGMFSKNVNPQWHENPYNADNGGPLYEPGEFATNEEAIRLWKNKLRYIAARWGYSPNILSWEWWNEVNWTPIVNPDLLIPWINMSAEHLKQFDPYNHLITHSGSHFRDDEVWELGSLDFVQSHEYSLNDWTRDTYNVARDWIERFEKPYLLGEFGYVQQTFQSEPNGVRLHLGLWSPIMAKAFGTGMFWWWDSYIHPNDLYYHFAGVANFFAGEDLTAHGYESVEGRVRAEDSVIREAYAYGLVSEERALFWVVSSSYNDAYARNNDEYPLLEGQALTFDGLADGAYTVEMWDTFEGTLTETTEVTVEGGAFTLELPPFDRDVAIKVIR